MAASSRMALTFYGFQLVCLVALCFFSIVVERWLSPRRKQGVHLHDEHAPTPALRKLSKQYLTVYAIVMGTFISSQSCVSCA